MQIALQSGDVLHSLAIQVVTERLWGASCVELLYDAMKSVLSCLIVDAIVHRSNNDTACSRELQTFIDCER